MCFHRLPKSGFDFEHRARVRCQAGNVLSRLLSTCANETPLDDDSFLIPIDTEKSNSSNVHINDAYVDEVVSLSVQSEFSLNTTPVEKEFIDYRAHYEYYREASFSVS